MPDPKHEILIVDDEDALRNSLALLLQSSGYHVTTAINGFDALLRSKIEVPAVVISDLNMPQMSGFEFPAILTRSPRRNISLRPSLPFCTLVVVQRATK